MKRKIIVLIVILINALLFSTYSQKSDKYFDSYVIKLNNDTIYGKMKNYASSITSREDILFWDMNNNKISYSAEEINGFYTQNRFFERVALKDKLGKSPNGYALLVRIIDGPMILYKLSKNKISVNILTNSLDTKCFDYYYIRKKEDNAALFVFRENCDYALLQINLQAKDLKKVADYFNEVPEIREKIKSDQFKASDLELIIKEYNKLYNLKNN